MLKKIGKFFAYAVAAIIILMAVAVGLLRIAMPQLPEYQEEITARIAAAIDGDIAFDRLDARWRLRGPEVVLYDVVLGERLAGQQVTPIRIDSIAVGVSVTELLINRRVQVRHVHVDGLRLALVRQTEAWFLQDLNLTEIARPAEPKPQTSLPGAESFSISIENAALEFQNAADQQLPVMIELPSAALTIDGQQIRMSAALRHRGERSATADLLLSGRVDAMSVAGAVAGDWTASTDISAVSATLLKSILPADWRLPRAGLANLEADADWRAGTLNAMVVSLDAERLIPADGDRESRVKGRAEWTQTDAGWLCAITDFSVGVSDRQWPPASVFFERSRDDLVSKVTFEMANVTVYDLPYLASFLPDQAAKTLVDTGISGTLIKTNGFLSFAEDKPADTSILATITDYEVNADFETLSISPIGALPGFRNLTGLVRMKPSTGRLALASTDASIVYPRVFARGLDVELLRGTLIWRTNARGVSLISDAVQLETSALTSTSSLELLWPADARSPVIDIESSWSLSDISDIDHLLPGSIIKPKLRTWLTTSLRAGRIRDGRFKLSGALADFPFDAGQGVFRASGTAENVVMRYAAKWPAVTNLTANVVLDGLRLSTSENSGISGGMPFRNTEAAIDNLRSGELSINSTGKATLAQVYRYSANSPLRQLFGDQFDNLRVDGSAAYALALNIPLKTIKDYTVEATFDTDDAALSLSTLPQGVSALQGQIRVDRDGAYGQGLVAQFLGQPIRIDLAPVRDDPAYAVGLKGEGVLTADAAVNRLALPLADRIDGQTAFSVDVRLPKANAGEAAPVEVSVVSTLNGLGLDLPYPIGKTADAERPLDIGVSIDDALALEASLGEMVDLVALLDREAPGTPLSLDRMTLHLGEGRALLSAVEGIYIDGRIDRLRLNDWLDLRLAQGRGFIDDLKSVSVEVADLYAYGQRIKDVRGGLQANDDQWLIGIESEAISGNISLPRDLSTGAPVVLEMRELQLLEGDPEADDSVDPTALPPLRVRAENFALGTRRFGALDAEINKIPEGLSIPRITTAAEAFTIEGSGQWVLDPIEELGSRTSLKANVLSSDVKKMMGSLGYQPGINADLLESAIDVSWAGGPREEFVASLDGTVSLKISNGTLDDVEPGAGRVVGLMSVAELPRRLALDFRDVFRKGFSFDEINGDFRIVNGEAYTCNLSLKGSSADVGLIGRASLERRNYNQTAIVSVKVGNTLPAVGAVVAGPQVGAALLLFSQIFKKPLQGMTEVFYQINGGWDEPSIERTDSARFAATAELADCLVSTGG